MARVFKLSQLWRTTTVRLTALFLLIFVVFSVLLLGLIWWQTTVQLQKAQTDSIDRETAALVRIDTDGGFRETLSAVLRLAQQPGPGIYYVADQSGQMLLGNVTDLPPEVLSDPGTFSFNYERPRQPGTDEDAPAPQGTALVRWVHLESGLILVVVRDI